jgi:hypothetical protein
MIESTTTRNPTAHPRSAPAPDAREWRAPTLTVLGDADALTRNASPNGSDGETGS